MQRKRNQLQANFDLESRVMLSASPAPASELATSDPVVIDGRSFPGPGGGLSSSDPAVIARQSDGVGGSLGGIFNVPSFVATLRFPF